MIRFATPADTEEIWRLTNQHELRVQPDFEAYPLSEIADLLIGHPEPTQTLVLDADGIRAVVCVQTSTPRKRLEVDLFTIGSNEESNTCFAAGLEWCRDNRAGFKLITTANKIDADLLAIFENHGLEFYRDYYKMVASTLPTEFPACPAGVEIRALDVAQHAALIHEIETKSFAQHFGFTEISAADWLSERLSDPAADSSGAFVLFENQRPAGYLLSSDARADVGGGWVDKLGVLEEYRGKGYGRLLLGWGMAHASHKGYRDIGLGVDTGNESGALALYEAMGFSPTVSWRAFYTQL